ncbi:aminoglycoside phosphotransferase family protein [Streptomyces sp. NPDC048416]|uniref:aminoglycoside phosphotransferase family protein n=1 Tax=Streptomyces sp. NPDC048416 TaxID=3365546 RepID=UPI00371531E7
MPEAMVRLVTSVSGTFRVVADHSSPGIGRPRTWEVEDRHGCKWFAKHNPGPKLFRREVAAYESGWAASLGPGRAPLLAAHDMDAQGLVVTAVPGRPVRGQRLTAEQEREVYRQAGQLLARLAAAPAHGQLPVSSTVDWDAEVEQMLRSARLYATPEDLKVLRALTCERPADLPAVVSHGDFMPRNWLWDPAEQVLRIIDFERADIRPSAQRDLPRLSYRILYGRPDLEASFFHGLGRKLCEAERHAVTMYGALDAMSLLRYGLEHQDLASVDEAHTMLRNLHTEHLRAATGGGAGGRRG